jgi:hypothetical protein
MSRREPSALCLALIAVLFLVVGAWAWILWLGEWGR